MSTFPLFSSLGWCSIFVADASEKESNFKESVVKAKKAVSLDIKDGTSWSESAAHG